MNKYIKHTIALISFMLPTLGAYANDLEISAEIAKIEANKVYSNDSTDFNAENYDFDFEKFENMLNDGYPTEAIGFYLKKVGNLPVYIQIDYNEKILEMLSNKINSIKDIKKYNFTRLNTDADTLREHSKEKDDSFWSIHDLYLIPIVVTIDCFGGGGAATVSYLGARTSIGMDIQNEAIAHNGKLLLGYISDLEKKDLSGFDSYKNALLIYDKYISELMQDAPTNNYKSILMHKNKVRELKKNLSERRMEYISSSFLAVRFIKSLSLAKTYNSQWGCYSWGRDEELIDGAFKALGNHGDLIMASSEDCRNAFVLTILPALKSKLSEKNYNSKITLTGYRADGSTGAKLWLDWEN